jgi:hypothetical protein
MLHPGRPDSRNKETKSVAIPGFLTSRIDGSSEFVVFFLTHAAEESGRAESHFDISTFPVVLSMLNSQKAVTSSSRIIATMPTPGAKRL